MSAVACSCRGLGVLVDFDDSVPGYLAYPCKDHPLPVDEKNSIDDEDAAAMRADEILEAVAAIRDILWPDGNPDSKWTPETIEDGARALNFLRPVES